MAKKVWLLDKDSNANPRIQNESACIEEILNWMIEQSKVPARATSVLAMSHKMLPKAQENEAFQARIRLEETKRKEADSMCFICGKSKEEHLPHFECKVCYTNKYETEKRYTGC